MSKIEKLFDFQKFSRNKDIDEMMERAERRNSSLLSDEELSLVSAAGTIPILFSPDKTAEPAKPD